MVTDSREVRSARPGTTIVAGLAAWVLRPTGVGGAFVGCYDVCGRSALRVVQGWSGAGRFRAVRTVMIIPGVSRGQTESLRRPRSCRPHLALTRGCYRRPRYRRELGRGGEDVERHRASREGWQETHRGD